MARNRKRAKERRARRPQQAPVAATARADRDARDETDAPDPIEHAAPDVELAEAQLALGRPEHAGSDNETDDGEVAATPFTDEEFEREEDEADSSIPGVLPGQARVEETSASGATVGEVTVQPRAPSLPGRLVNFIQGSWRELQRVQWPDRRQVMQATGVVIGFVIVAGVFLGVADLLSSKVMNYILTGHFK